MAFDFKSIYDQEFPIYIHSNTSNFQNAFQEESFEFFLEELASGLIKTLEEDIRFFENIEQTIVDKQIGKFQELGIKPAFSNKDEYLDYLRDYKAKAESNPANGLYGLVNLKLEQPKYKKAQDNAISSIKKIYSKVIGVAPQDVKANLSEILADPSLDKDSESAIQEVLKITNEKELQLAKDSAGFLSVLIPYLYSIYDPTVSEVPKAGLQKSASKLQTRFQELIHDVKKMDSTASDFNSLLEPRFLLENITQKINDMGPLNFFSFFREKSKSTEFFGSVLKENIDSPAGGIFEIALLDGIVDKIEKDIGKGIYPVFDKKKVKLTSTITGIDKSSTIDISFDGFQNAGIETIFGASLKLINDDSLIKSETSVDPLWESFIRFVGKQNVFKYSYLRQNLFSLTEFAADNESLQIKFDLNYLAEFEKRLFSILSSSRLFLGLYESLENQEKKSVGFNDKLYFAAYLWEKDNIYRTTDVLKVILNGLKEKKSSDIIVYDSRFFPKKNDIKVPREKLETLYEHKKNQIKKLTAMNKEVSYKEFLRDGDILKTLNELNSIIGRHGYEGKQLSISTSPKKLAQFFPQSKK